MPDVYFNTNPAEWGLLEGLYIDERPPPGFITGVDLFTIGIAGACVRGPETPQVITSKGRFAEVYGTRGYQTGGTLVGEVWKGMVNKPAGTTVVRRVVAAAATAATATFSTFLRVDASSRGAWGNSVLVSVENASDGDANHFNLRVKWLARQVLYQNVNIFGTADNLATVLGSDVGNLVICTKLLAGRPANVVDTALTTGADGALAASDYVAGITDIAAYPGVNICLVAENAVTQATLNTTLLTLAADAVDRLFLTWSGVHGQSVSTEITTKTSQIGTPSDRVVWCFNSAQTLDPETGALMDVAPHTWMASILSQNDVNVHPGAPRTVAQTAGIISLRNEALQRGDLKLLKGAGIAALEHLPDGFRFRSGVTTITDQGSGKTEITRRRMADYLELSAADRLRFFVKELMTDEERAQMIGELHDFSQEDKDRNHVIKKYSIADPSTVNTEAAQARGEEHILWRVQTLRHALSLVVTTEIGTGVVIKEAA